MLPRQQIIQLVQELTPPHPLRTSGGRPKVDSLKVYLFTSRHDIHLNIIGRGGGGGGGGGGLAEINSFILKGEKVFLPNNRHSQDQVSIKPCTEMKK